MITNQGMSFKVLKSTIGMLPDPLPFREGLGPRLGVCCEVHMDTESLSSILLWTVHSPFPGILSQFGDVLESDWLWDVGSCLHHFSQHPLKGD